MPQITILGAGMAGFGAAHHLSNAGHRPHIFDRHSFHGGHAASFRHDGGWIFDDGPHISFTRNERIRELFADSVHQQYETFQAQANNYWRGHWIKHPAQCNLHGLPTDLLVKILADFVQASTTPPTEIRNYADWLIASFGRTFAETFPMQYGRKFHTTTADNMTTEWLGPRLYRPTLEEVLRGALSPVTADVHYITESRYPTNGGFVSYFDRFLKCAETHLNHEVVNIDVRGRAVRFASGATVGYDALISSLPLPTLIKLIPDAPADVCEAAARLAWTGVLVVNIGIDRRDISPAHWSYFYDDDIIFSRLSFPHMQSPHTVPTGAGSIQAEIYFSEKYKPLQDTPESYIPRVIADLKRCGLMTDRDRILFSQASKSPFAQVIFDLERAAALATLRGYLEDVGIAACGRYGEWGYLWTDESFVSGERAAGETLRRLGLPEQIALSA